MLRLAGMRTGFKVLDPMGGVGTIAIEAAVHWPGVEARTSDISMDATKGAELNAEQARPLLAEGSSLLVAQEDARRLSLPGGSVDAVVTDVPFGNRNRSLRVFADLLPKMSSEIARVLRPRGRAVLLMTRGHARQVAQIISYGPEMAAMEALAHGAVAPKQMKLERRLPLLVLECRKVVVGGWPATVLVLERTPDEECSSDSEAEGEQDGEIDVDEDHCGDAACEPQPLVDPKKTAVSEPRDCVLVLPFPRPAFLDGVLSDVLLRRWPSHFPTESVVRRVIRRSCLGTGRDEGCFPPAVVE